MLTYPLQYEVRVHGKLYLWGSAGIKTDTMFAAPLLLHVRNDAHGEEVSLGTQVADGTETLIGALQPGQLFSIPIQRLSGVVAACSTESTLHCVITAH
jgi:hypothetical protein